MNESVWPVLFAAFLTAGTAWCIGKALLRSMRLRLFRIEEDVLAFLSGSALLSAFLFLLCSLHLARKGVFVAIAVACGGLLYWKRWIMPSRERSPWAPRVWMMVFFVPFVIYAALYLVNALAPPINPGNTIHALGNVVRWWSDFGFDRSNVTAFANAPQALEMLFLFAFAFGRHSGAILLSFIFLLSIPLLMVCYGRRFGMPIACVFGALMLFLSPAAGILGTNASHEIAAAAALLGAFYWLELWSANGDDRLLALAGLLAGFSCSISYVGAIGLIGTVLYAAGILVLRRKPPARALALMLCSAGVMILPWLVKNWLWTGDPISPFANGWFESAAMHVSAEKWYAEVLGLGSPMTWKQLAALWSLDGSSTVSLFGPWLLLTPLALLAARRKRGWQWLAPALFFGFFAMLFGASSMVLFFAIFAAPALGLALENTPGGLMLVLCLQTLTNWPGVVMTYAAKDAWIIREIPAAGALRRVSDNDYLSSRFPEYNLARSVEVRVPGKAHVLTTWPVPQAYTRRLLFNDRESARAELGAAAISAAYASASPRRIAEAHFRFTPQTLRRVRTVATVSTGEPWQVYEMRVYLAGQEIARQPAWRVSAKPNGVESPLAFDSSEVTAWNSWEPARPGMFVEEIFPIPAIVDDVALIYPLPAAAGFHAEGLGGDNRWRPLGAKPEISEHSPPPGMRRAAIEQVKSLGFDYLVARDDVGAGRDMLRYPSYWGVACIEETGTVCVFHLQ